jgi:glycogen debranching enzyme
MKGPSRSLWPVGCRLNDAKPLQFYIATKSSPADERSRVLKYGKLFAVFDRFGDIESGGLGEEGIFFEGTRFLSELVLRIGSNRPMLLSSTVREDNALFTADLTNIDITQGEGVLIPRGSLHVKRLKTLWRTTCFEQLLVSNYGLSPIRIPISVQFSNDFADLFEVRGTKRLRAGEHLEPEVKQDAVSLSYRGLDGLVRRSHIRCNPAPDHISSDTCRFDLAIQPREHVVLELAVSCQQQQPTNPATAFSTALKAVTEEMRAATDRASCYVHSGSEQFNGWLRRSIGDVQMMIVGNPESDYPYAGVPWFSTVFGRDGIITALECLWKNPQIAKGVLQYLAATQAHQVIPESDAEPGKILHEARLGEMAALKEVPFGRYYGAVDTTPLFIVLAAAYYQRTAELKFIDKIWPHIEAALEWIKRYGDRDGDGFVEYYRNSSKGLVQQGWKDSSDSIFHADGTIADPPIALCEVQGYVFAAKQGAAQLARLLARPDRARELEDESRQLQARFEESFWCPELEMYALALDRDKKPCRVRTSNAGHCLFAGIASPEHAAAVARALLKPDFFSGWGVRTVAAGEARYNPVSYHNGSVWPHDNAMLALGFARYGLRDAAARILSGLLDTSAAVELHRLPELLCGLERRPGEGPTLYPVACAPQAWAAGAVFMLLEACLGISVSAPENRLVLEEPYLPPPVSRVWIRNLAIASASIDLLFERTTDNVRVEVTERRGDLEVIVR